MNYYIFRKIYQFIFPIENVTIAYGDCPLPEMAFLVLRKKKKIKERKKFIDIGVHKERRRISYEHLSKGRKKERKKRMVQGRKG